MSNTTNMISTCSSIKSNQFFKGNINFLYHIHISLLFTSLYIHFQLISPSSYGTAFQLDNLGDLIINSTTQGFGSPLGYYSFKRNQSQDIIIEFVHYNEDAYFSLSWQSLSTDVSLIPPKAFKYYQNITFTNLTILTSSVDPQESLDLLFFAFFIFYFFHFYSKSPEEFS